MLQLLSPRSLAFRGHIEVFAWGFPRSLLSPTELQRRVLSLWQSGARLEEFDWGHVLVLPSSQKIRAENAPALPLTRHKNRLVAAPVARDDELGDGIWVIEDGKWHALHNKRVVDVSAWLDVGAWSVPTTTSLGDVPEVPTVIVPVALDLRSQSGIQAPDPKWQTIWERGPQPSSGLSLPQFSPSRLFDALSRLFTPRREAGDVPIASNRSIALSGVLVLGGAVLFLIYTWSAPRKGGEIPLSEIGSIAVVAVVVFLARGKLSWPGARAQQPRSVQAPPIVVSRTVQTITGALLAVGMVRLAVLNPGAAMSALFFLIVVLVLGRLVGLTGTLIGQRAVSGGSSSTPLTIGGIIAGLSWLSSWFKARSGSQKNTTASQKTRDTASDLWRRLMASAALKSGLFKRLGQAQARYLLHSMELFERGDLEAALRHAIPLGSQPDSQWTPPPALGVPNARNDLNISLANAPARGTMNFGPEVEERLRALYRRAFEKLRDAGDVQKAAFVLAELLQNAEEAVTFLEEHREFELAARLAEGRGLPAGIVVRAWWLAGNRKRAVQIAQLKGAFADAIVRLEKDPKNSDDVAALRLLWGHHLASLGRFAPAVEAVWPVPQGRPFASQWLRLGLQEGVSPRLLARALFLEPDAWGEWRPHIETLLSGERDENGTRRRERFARDLVTSKSAANASVQVAARWTARTLLRDARGEGGNLEKNEWETLLTLSGDGLLHTDSHWPAPRSKSTPLSANNEPLEIHINSDGGTLNARDAVLLENGELLVALGEMGARLLSRDGRVKTQFDVPAHTLVSAFDAPRALLVAPRDEILRVAILDLSSRKTKYWGDVRASCFAPNFDGATWFIGAQSRVRAFDMTAPTPSALWDSGETNGHVRELALRRVGLAALVEHVVPANSFLPAARGAIPGSASFESWNFEIPSLILRTRLTPPNFPKSTDAISNIAGLNQRRIGDNGFQFAVGTFAFSSTEVNESEIIPWLEWLYEGHKAPIGSNPQQYFGTVMIGNHAMILWRDATGVLASLLWRPTNKIAVNFRFEGANQVHAHECDGLWLLWDDLGRIVTFNPTTQRIEHEWILS